MERLTKEQLESLYINDRKKFDSIILQYYQKDKKYYKQVIKPIIDNIEAEDTKKFQQALSNFITTTGDIKEEYKILGPVYFQVSNKGIFSSSLTKLKNKYQDIVKETKNEYRRDWGFLYGELSFGMENDFDTAFFCSVRELEARAIKLGADAIVWMRQDIDLDTNAFQWFYLQMYGTAVKIIRK